MDTQQYTRQKMQEIGLNEEQIDLVETLQKAIEELKYYKSRYYQIRASDRYTIDEYIYAKEDYRRAKEKLKEFEKK